MMFQPPPIGTAAIMPPEQWQRRGTATVQIDIYNLGCTLFYVLTGELPFGGDGTLDLMHQQWTRVGTTLKGWQESLDRRSSVLSEAGTSQHLPAACASIRGVTS